MKPILSIILFLLGLTFLEANKLVEKRVLYVNSYHTGYFWSDAIEKAIKNTLRKSSIPIKFKKIEMDTKRNTQESYKLEAALKVKNLIDKFKPDVVITSDDNAAKYVIVPFFKNSSIPFIFCGVNASADKYGFSSKNVTGMVGVQLIPQLVESLEQYTKERKIGYLRGDSLTSRIESKFFEELVGRKIDVRLVTTVEAWKKNFLDLQNRVDILLIGNGSALPTWNNRKKEIKLFAKNNTKIPSGSWDSVISEISLLTYSTIPEEQGNWAAKTALKVLSGADISKINIVENKKAKIYINTTLAKKLNIIFSFDMIDNAVLVQ